jgi:CDP-diacylglycerol--glycerol-3-phosphate 3-phosphatidyltransferase
MPSIYDLKPAFQRLLRPVVRGLAGAGVTANQVTLAALVLSAANGALIAWQPAERWPLLLLGPTLFVRMALNAIDGMLAREHGMKSALGAILNEIGDVAADAALYLPLALVPGFEPRLVVGAVILAVFTEMTGVVCVQIGASRRYDGPFGKSDRAFAFGALGLLVGLGVPAGAWVTAVLAMMILLLAATVLNRARKGLAELKR